MLSSILSFILEDEFNGPRVALAVEGPEPNLESESELLFGVFFEKPK